ncbi:hypothetical protein BV133_1967 [Blastochloris viridis]|uniref:Uncharacterized protein n=1 Tax=Blastochloris viridis TaxID=1079 RepID=A0A182D253_BLAVI|nr:hypothetical protein BV133_1967 [Blastochloris viridis]
MGVGHKIASRCRGRSRRRRRRGPAVRCWLRRASLRRIAAGDAPRGGPSRPPAQPVEEMSPAGAAWPLATFSHRRPLPAGAGQNARKSIAGLASSATPPLTSARMRTI